MDNVKKLEQLRHSAAHLLAHAIQELYPDTLLTIGPATAEGFFYDILPAKNFKEECLPLIEKRMHEIAERSLPLTHELMFKKEACILFQHNKFKLELIDGIPGDQVGIARQGDFVDLCKGGHVENTNQIQHVKLLSISGSYWRADRNGQPLQRISGTAFWTAQELEQFEKQKEDALKYDHRRIGKALDLFSFQDEGPGFPFYHPHGKLILNILTDHLKKLLFKYGHVEISTPAMLSDELWKRSGHYQFYKDNMYFCTIDEKEYAIKPMNCPGAILVYDDRPHSYKELPLRYAEFGHVHRYELSGVMHGLFRARAFIQDDAHIFCMPEQLDAEIGNLIKLHHELIKPFNFTTSVRVATKPAKSLGSDHLWNIATTALINGLKQQQYSYELAEGEGAFYGPKIEFHLLDSMGRSWQCGTIQVDFFQSENFDLSYISTEGKKERPVIIHRALYGSMERFFGILLEHYKGKLPFWLSPVQIKVLSITDEQKDYAHSVAQFLIDSGIRTTVDESSDQISGQIKTACAQGIPWALILGKKEVEKNTVTLRYADGKQEFNLTLQELVKKALHTINDFL
ncbi:MAG TPA: threonine--tRNA ligase [Patescibacteria group bacterium]|nr:threonine--tRNA ligase [Patescibacteria group bacterium]